jgi:hypothetical protein
MRLLNFGNQFPSSMDKSMDKSCLIKVEIMIHLFFKSPDFLHCDGHNWIIWM